MVKNTGGHKNDRLFFGEMEIMLCIMYKVKDVNLGEKGQNNEERSYFFTKVYAII